MTRRLHWGCGDSPREGWINSDIKDEPGIDLPCDVLEGIPLEEGSVDYAASVHALQEIHPDQQVPVLAELHRVLRVGGALRLVLPDLLKAVEAYRRGDRSFFLIPDEDAER